MKPFIKENYLVWHFHCQQLFKMYKIITVPTNEVKTNNYTFNDINVPVHHICKHAIEKINKIVLEKELFNIITSVKFRLDEFVQNLVMYETRNKIDDIRNKLQNKVKQSTIETSHYFHENSDIGRDMTILNDHLDDVIEDTTNDANIQLDNTITDIFSTIHYVFEDIVIIDKFGNRHTPNEFDFIHMIYC